MGANRCPTPRTRSRMRWERRLYGMNQQAGASCPSRTPSISLAPPHASLSLSPALRHPLYPPAPPVPCDHLPSSLFPLLVDRPFVILFHCSSAVRGHVVATYYLVLLKSYFSPGTRPYFMRDEDKPGEHFCDKSMLHASLRTLLSLRIEEIYKEIMYFVNEKIDAIFSI